MILTISEFSETAKALAGNELINLMREHDAADRYSYFYRGSNQSLDDIFISQEPAGKAVFAPVHINTSFMEEHGRASDHDPVVVQLDFLRILQLQHLTLPNRLNPTGQSSAAVEQGAPSQTNPPSSIKPDKARQLAARRRRDSPRPAK